MLMGKENGVVEPWLNRHSRVQWYPAPLFTSHTDGNFFYLNLQFKRKINHWRKRNTRRGIHAHTHTHTHARKRVKKNYEISLLLQRGARVSNRFLFFPSRIFHEGRTTGNEKGGGETIHFCKPWKSDQKVNKIGGCVMRVYIKEKIKNKINWFNWHTDFLGVINN